MFYILQYSKTFSLQFKQKQAGKYEEFPAKVTAAAFRFYQHSLNVAPGAVLKTLSQWFLSCFLLVCNEPAQMKGFLPAISLMRKHGKKRLKVEAPSWEPGIPTIMIRMLCNIFLLESYFPKQCNWKTFLVLSKLPLLQHIIITMCHTVWRTTFLYCWQVQKNSGSQSCFCAL